MSQLPEDVDYIVEKEDWNVYELGDGSTLKTKFVMIKVARGIDAQGNASYVFSSQNVVAAITPNDKKGTPTAKKYSRQELEASIVDEMDFKTREEGWNIYQLRDGSKLEIKLILTRVAKTDKFEPTGSPIYLTNTQTVVKPKISKELQKKLVSAKKRALQKKTRPIQHIV